jgi:hypothetical protein
MYILCIFSHILSIYTYRLCIYICIFYLYIRIFYVYLCTFYLCYIAVVVRAIFEQDFYYKIEEKEDFPKSKVLMKFSNENEKLMSFFFPNLY